MPSCPASPKPAEITTTARTPFAAHSRTAPTAAVPGTAIAASSGLALKRRSLIDRPAPTDHLGGRVDGIHRAPETGSSRLWNSSPPTVPARARRRSRRSTAVRKKRATAAAAAIRLRPSKRLIAWGEKEVGNRTWIEPGAEEVSTRKPLSARKDLDHPVVLRQHLGLERRDPRLVGELREVAR